MKRLFLILLALGACESPAPRQSSSGWRYHDRHWMQGSAPAAQLSMTDLERQAYRSRRNYGDMLRTAMHGLDQLVRGD